MKTIYPDDTQCLGETGGLGENHHLFTHINHINLFTTIALGLKSCFSALYTNEVCHKQHEYKHKLSGTNSTTHKVRLCSLTEGL